MDHIGMQCWCPISDGDTAALPTASGKDSGERKLTSSTRTSYFSDGPMYSDVFSLMFSLCSIFYQKIELYLHFLGSRWTGRFSWSAWDFMVHVLNKRGEINFIVRLTDWLIDWSDFTVFCFCVGSVHGPAEYSVVMEIILSSNQRVLVKHETTFASDGTESIFRVMFKKPVEIQPGIHYTVSACLKVFDEMIFDWFLLSAIAWWNIVYTCFFWYVKGPDSFYGTRGVRKVVKVINPQSSPAAVFNFIYSPGNNNGTSVEDGQIPEIIFHTHWKAVVYDGSWHRCLTSFLLSKRKE